MRIILLLAFSLMLVGCPDPEPDCPQDCQKIFDRNGELESCLCPPEVFDEYAEEKCEEITEERCEDEYW